MSKMSDLAMVLDEQAIDLGFDNYEEAMLAGYEVDYKSGKLIEPQEQAHKEWLAMRNTIIDQLEMLRHRAVMSSDFDSSMVLGNAIAFIKEGER